MKIMAIEREIKELPQELRDGILAREAAAAWRLSMAETIREAYLTEGKTRAVLVLECADEAEARRALSELPLAAEGYIDFDLFRLEPYPGYARLFARPTSPARP